jgi:hypothetical protein
MTATGLKRFPYVEEERCFEKLREDATYMIPGVDDIQQTMNVLALRIRTAVGSALNALGIQESQPILWNDKHILPHDLTELLCTLLGCSELHVQKKMHELLSSQNHKNISLSYFLRAVIGAAIKEWCLDPLPQGRRFWAELGGGCVHEGLADGESSPQSIILVI